HADALEVELHRRDIPYVKYGGLRFLEAAHVKDLLAMLRLLENPRDELAWFRVLQLVEAVGPATATRLIDDLGVRGLPAGRGPAEPLARFVASPLRLPGGALEEMSALREAVADCLQASAGGAGGPAVDIERLRRFLDPAVTRRYERPVARLADLDALQRVAAGYASRARLLADLILDPPSSTSDLAGPGSHDDDWLVL